jgi:hypothetical protein
MTASFDNRRLRASMTLPVVVSGSLLLGLVLTGVGISLPTNERMM